MLPNMPILIIYKWLSMISCAVTTGISANTYIWTLRHPAGEGDNVIVIVIVVVITGEGTRMYAR